MPRLDGGPPRSGSVSRAASSNGEPTAGPSGGPSAGPNVGPSVTGPSRPSGNFTMDEVEARETDVNVDPYANDKGYLQFTMW